ncbi:hypothetical protein E4U22_001646 [Claviceps purpurea]|nr:hypothetical protein E4U34_006704 [Claviceps purpurea]KAG6280499.1 hypothetical protein E4U46_000520 [Claviceps purpurea]KAG6312655.1 hypothetical protein E4U22_001646 [Claviceps purpurea]
MAPYERHEALCGFRLSKTRVGDILVLVRFCYERRQAGSGPEFRQAEDAAGSMIAAEYELRTRQRSWTQEFHCSNLMADCFQQLLKERGDFAADMAWVLASRGAGSTKC